jgi:RNA polymerase sigma-70 factor (ECF subfamily)
MPVESRGATERWRLHRTNQFERRGWNKCPRVESSWAYALHGKQAQETASLNLRFDHVVAQEELAVSDESATADTVVVGGAARVPDRDGDRGGVADANSADRFVRLVIPHLDDAYTLARWITGDRIDAEDVVQEACLRAFRTISNTTDDNARAWTLAAVRNAAFAWLRKYRPAALVPLDEFGPVEREQMRSWDSDGETPEAALIAKTDTAILEAAVAELPAPFREALVLRDIQGLSYREIADVTGVPIGTVMSRLARGRTRLIKIIGRMPR